jgi:pSer/pThr/pTyr-binding forkhead associated (FHA) protein
METPPHLSSPPAVASADEPLPAGFVPLRLLLQPGGLCLEVTRAEALIGRHSSADIRLCLPDISRRHCRCLFTGGQWRIVDQNSLNGTFVNEERVQEAVLHPGDRVRIGSLQFVVQFAAAAPTVVLPERERAAGPRSVLQRLSEILPFRQVQRKAS